MPVARTPDGKPVAWAAKPTHTPAQLQARFGAGAQLVRAGDGRWVVKVPDGSPAAQGQPASAGGGVPAPAPAAAPAPPPIPQFDPTNDPRYQGLQRELRALPTSGNEARRQFALTALRDLVSEGFFEGGQVFESGRRGSGINTDAGAEIQNLLFGVRTGARGRVFRDALAQNNRGFNAAGAFFSSAREDANTDTLHQIGSSVNAALNFAADQQNTSLTQQGKGTTAIRGQLTDLTELLRGEHQDRFEPAAGTPTPAELDGGPQPAGEAGNPAAAAAASNGARLGGGGSIIVNGKPVQFGFDPRGTPTAGKVSRRFKDLGKVSFVRRGDGKFLAVVR